MTWADAFPNLLIGLREGLEAGLVISILLAALRRTAGEGRRVSTAPVWLGVVGAVAVAASFATVLTFSTDVLSSSGQETVGGLLSVLAVILVTGMVFWMRKTAASLSGELRSKVAAASQVGAGALAATAFLAVGREGLETTLFLWTAARASGETVSPLVGAGLGLALACLVCWLLFRRAIRINLGVFFSRTALALLVITAGVLAYGLGELQNSRPAPRPHLAGVRRQRDDPDQFVVGHSHHGRDRAHHTDDGARGRRVGRVPGRRRHSVRQSLAFARHSPLQAGVEILSRGWTAAWAPRPPAPRSRRHRPPLRAPPPPRRTAAKLPEPPQSVGGRRRDRDGAGPAGDGRRGVPAVGRQRGGRHEGHRDIVRLRDWVVHRAQRCADLPGGQPVRAGGRDQPGRLLGGHRRRDRDAR